MIHLGAHDLTVGQSWSIGIGADNQSHMMYIRYSNSRIFTANALITYFMNKFGMFDILHPSRNKYHM